MAEIRRYRFRQPGMRHSYTISQDRVEHWLVTERDARTGHERHFRTTWAEVESILNLPDAAQYEGAANLYHRQRIAERNRKEGRSSGVEYGQPKSNQ